MGSSPSKVLPRAMKVMVAGHFGVGKTTMVSSISEISLLRTEETLTDAGLGIDDLAGVEQKRTTTVAMDFGRITISEDLVLYLFGTPGQERFSFLWDDLVLGAIGAVVLADTRRLKESFPCVDFFEARTTPFMVAVNCFADGKTYTPQDVLLALNLDPEVPVMLCDARDRLSVKAVLITLLQHVIQRQRQ